MKHGPLKKIKDLLARSARALIDKMDTTTDPWWFSTSGDGVAWLHMRIDPRPKYYNHVQYKDRPETNNEDNITDKSHGDETEYSENSLLSNEYHQSYETIRGNVVMFDKTKVGPNTFKFEPISNFNLEQLTFKEFMEKIGQKDPIIYDFMDVLRD